MEIYFKPHSSRIQEQIFFRFIIESISEFDHIENNFSLPSSLINELLNRDEIIELLEKDLLLPSKKIKTCIDELKKLPNEIRIAESIAKISVDYVIIDKKEIFYIEFHEKQHRRLSVDRLTPIFSNDLTEYRIPRFHQRLLRDIWRLKNLSNYKIIWWDWFEENPKAKINFLSKGKSEFYLPNKFSLIKLCSD
jgi:hypothetical protein